MFRYIIIFLIRIILYLFKKSDKILNSISKLIYNYKNSLLLQSKYTIKSKDQIDSFLLMKDNGKVESLYFPSIYNLSIGGEIKVFTKGIQVYEFKEVSFSMNSDFIRFSDNTIYCDKLNRYESIFNKFGDIDFVNQTNNVINLLDYKKFLYFDYVIHMTGCFSKVWTHFLVQIYPKLEYLNLIPKSQKATVILPVDIDNHIIQLIQNYVVEFENISIVLAENSTLIKCKKVFYVSIDTWLGDIGLLPSMFHIKISDSTTSFIFNQINKLHEKNRQSISKKIINSNKKIFIGRTGKRNIENYAQVLNFFESLGFIEIFPHLLSFEEKVQLFSNAEFITGPASSGFANIIFCRSQPKVLSLTNLSRHDDLFLTKFTKHLGINFQTLLGKEKTPGYPDSNYYIDMVDLKNCFSSLLVNT